MKTKICVSIIERNGKSITKSAQKAKRLGADLIELRLDFIPNLNENTVMKITKEVKKLNLPIILTIRREDFGGEFPIKKENERINLLLNGAKNVDFIDIELETRKKERLIKLIENVKSIGTKVIVSSHDLEKTPTLEKILKILNEEKNLEADICKFVSKANKIDDNLTTLSANILFKGKKILFCSGELGRSSRILAPLFGSEFTFASLEKGKESITGQLDIKTTRMLVNEFKVG